MLVSVFIYSFYMHIYLCILSLFICLECGFSFQKSSFYLEMFLCTLFSLVNQPHGKSREHKRLMKRGNEMKGAE